jgi:hypothetical protein
VLVVVHVTELAAVLVAAAVLVDALTYKPEEFAVTEIPESVTLK